MHVLVYKWSFVWAAHTVHYFFDNARRLRAGRDDMAEKPALVDHGAAIADAVALPIFVYNIPGRTGKNIEPETICRLAEVDNITMVNMLPPIVESNESQSYPDLPGRYILHKILVRVENMPKEKFETTENTEKS